MALNTFGWTPAEVTTDSAGNVISGVTLTVFTDVTKSNQVTGLFDKDGTTPLASGVVVSDAKGRFGFKASDAFSMLYVYDGSTADPWPIAAHEALDQGMASHAQAVADAQAAADSAAASAALVGAPAGSAIDARLGGDSTNLITTVAGKITKGALYANVKDYGAVGDGTADDTTAVQAAVTASAGKAVFLPPGTYKITAPVTLPAGTVITGSSTRQVTVASTHSGAVFTTNTPGVRSYSWRISNLTISGPGKGTAGATGIDMDSMSTSHVSDVVVTGFDKAIRVRSVVNGGAVYDRFTNVSALSSTTGFAVEATGSNATTFDRCRANLCTYGWDITDSNDNTLNACQIEGNTTGIRVTASASSLADCNAVIASRFEGNTTAWNVTSANVREFLVLNPHPFGTYTIADSGTRTQHIGVTNQQGNVYQSQFATASGSWRFVRGVGATGSEPAVVFKDSNTATGIPITVQIETERAGSFLKGTIGGVNNFEVTTAGEISGLIHRGGPVATGASGISGIGRFLASSTTEGEAVGYHLYVKEGVNNRRASLFLDDTAGEVGISASASSGNPLFVLKWSTNQFTVDSTGNTTASGWVKVKAVATASRPSASTAGAGASVYDTTLSKPVWSDGTVWRDAAGTAV